MYPTVGNEVGVNLHPNLHPPAKLDCMIYPPKPVKSDHGPQFESTLFSEFLIFERIQTIAHHPSANGMVMRLHCQLKAALVSHANRKHCVDTQSTVLLIRSYFKPPFWRVQPTLSADLQSDYMVSFWNK